MSARRQVAARGPRDAWTRLRQWGHDWRARAAGRRRTWLLYVSVLVPGLVAASAGNDAGGIATYASVGARYGYDLIWVMVATLFGMIIVQEQCARMGAVTGKGLSDLIREQYGPRWTVVAMLCLLVANAGSICEAFGWERGVDLEPRQAPVFYGLLTFLIAAGALVALVPGVPVIRLLIAVQVVNALLLPVLLVFIARMAGDRGLMGAYANGHTLRPIAWLVTTLVASLALLLVVTTIVLPLLGISLGA